MIKLKSLITEQVLDKTKPFSLSDRDPYEYKLVGTVWYTKLRTATEWLDMKSKISSPNYELAVSRLNRELAIGKDDPKKPVVDPKKPVVDPEKPKNTNIGNLPIIKDSPFVFSKTPMIYNLSKTNSKIGEPVPFAPWIYKVIFTRQGGTTDLLYITKTDVAKIKTASAEVACNIYESKYNSTKFIERQEIITAQYPVADFKLIGVDAYNTFYKVAWIDAFNNELRFLAPVRAFDNKTSKWIPKFYIYEFKQ